MRVASTGLNPMDWYLASMPDLAQTFGVTVPSGFGYDFAGAVDEVGDDAEGFAVGDRVYGGILGGAAADYVVATPPAAGLRHTPDDISDEVAATLSIAGLTADAALDAVGLRAGDTILIGGAAGGVGVFAVQLARLAGARVIGTGSERSHTFLRELAPSPSPTAPVSPTASERSPPTA